MSDLAPQPAQQPPYIFMLHETDLMAFWWRCWEPWCLQTSCCCCSSQPARLVCSQHLHHHPTSSALRHRLQWHKMHTCMYCDQHCSWHLAGLGSRCWPAAVTSFMLMSVIYEQLSKPLVHCICQVNVLWHALTHNETLVLIKYSHLPLSIYLA